MGTRQRLSQRAPGMRAKPLSGLMIHQQQPSRTGEKGGVVRNGSSSTICRGGDGPETSACAGCGGLPRYNGPDKSENGDCNARWRVQSQVVRHLVSAGRLAVQQRGKSP